MRLPNERQLTKAEIELLARKIGGRDPVAEKLNAGRYSSIAEAEAQIPWLRKRRRGR